ncbi:uncharacterized protein LOC105353906 isoform X2 [Oryzias latipes]|uniref:uncharacterized protein LOC105353906 isoform X2 n=1 Tax=Oryzias latipes TaxID=8090 RepID=UPI0005CB96A2|nr:uncharacterized protein LOC105353906 isoform X2 [Oryzias latipes]
MTQILLLAFLWILIITQIGFVCSDVELIERFEGESVVFQCAFDLKKPRPIGVSLNRTKPKHSRVLFKMTEMDFAVDNQADAHRVRVSGDPKDSLVNITLSQLTSSDTSLYICEFDVGNQFSADEKVLGEMEFLLVVGKNEPFPLEVEMVQTHVGGSAVLPCFPPNAEGLAVDGVTLKRQKGRGPVEVVYQSKTSIPTEKVQLVSDGVAFNVSLQQLQVQDSALYSCQLLLRDKPDSGHRLGRRAYFVSVQGGECGCLQYSILLYAMSAAVALLLLHIIVVAVCKSKAKHSGKSHPQVPIYEEMVGVNSPSQKTFQSHLEEMGGGEYRNCSMKKTIPENHYESPKGILIPQNERLK